MKLKEQLEDKKKELEQDYEDYICIDTRMHLKEYIREQLNQPKTEQ